MKNSYKFLCLLLTLIMLLQNIVLPLSAVSDGILSVNEDEATDAGTEENEYILYEENFDGIEQRVDLDGGSNLVGSTSGWIYSKKSTNSEAYIENGRLYFSGSKYDVIYRDGGQTWGNYTLEADFCYTDDSNGWGGLLYNLQADDTFQKAGITSAGAYSLNGMVNGSWKNNETGVNRGFSLNQAFSAETPFRMKVVVFNKTATFYYSMLGEDGAMKSDWIELLSIDNIPAASQTGSIGFMTSNGTLASFWVDNIKCYSNTEVSYSENFDSYGDLTLEQNAENTTVGLNYVHNTSVEGGAQIKDGKLYLSGGGQTFDAVFFTMGQNWTNYVVESDFTYVSVTNKGWAGMLFRSTDIENFYKGGISMAGSGVLNCRADNKWYQNDDSTRKNTTFCSAFEYGQTIRFRISVNETTASFYAAFYENDVLGEWKHVVTINKEILFADAHMQGTIGFIVGGAYDDRLAEICLDNVTVSRNGDRLQKPDSIMADIYRPESGIVNPPVVVQELTDTLPATYGERAAVVMAEIDKDMNILSSNGSILMTVSDFIDTYSRVLIPAFVVDSAEEATTLAALLHEKEIIDCYVIADEENAALVRQVRMANETTSFISGALIFDDLNSLENRQKARALVSDNMCYVAISRAALSAEAAHYFNLRQIAAWSYAEDAADVYTGIANGYHGIVSTAPATVYDVYESIEVTTVSGKPVIIGHRGAGQGTSADPAYPENTLIGFRAAKEIFGVDAVELDFGLTKDGYVIVMHDSTVDRTTDGTGAFSSLTLAEIKALTVDYIAGKETTVPTFEEVLILAKEIGLVLYCHTKSNTDDNIAAFSYLVEKYEMWDNVILFAADRTVYHSNNNNVVSSTAYGFTDQKVVTDGIVFTAGNQTVLSDKTTYLTGVEAIRKCIAPYNYQPLFYAYSQQGAMWSSEAFYYQLSARGFVNSHSVTNGQETMDSLALTESGSVGFLTDKLHLADDYHYGLDIDDEALILKAGEKLNLSHALKMLVGEVTVNCGFLQLSGPELVSLDDGYTLNKGGSTVIVFYANRTTDGGTEYRVYSEPVTITWVEGLGIENTTNENSFGIIGTDVRLIGKQGLRFTAIIGNSVLEKFFALHEDNCAPTASGNTVIGYGFVLLPEDMVQGELTKESQYALIVPAVNYATSDDSRLFSAVITGIADSQLNRVITARAYITYKDGNGVIYTIYSDAVSTSLAETAANNINELQNLVDRAEALK